MKSLPSLGHSLTLGLFFVATLFVPFSSVKAVDVVWDPGNNVSNYGSWITEIFSSVSNEATAIATGLIEGSTGSLFTKEYIFDQIAFILAKEALQSLNDSVIDWVGSGFEGSPAFVTNLRNHMRSLGDSLTNDFIGQLTGSGMIDSPFRDTIANALQGEYYRSTGDDAYFSRSQFTLSQYTSDVDAFYRGECGENCLGTWIQAWMNPQNNPFGAYERADSELSRRIRDAQSNRSDELNRNQGFLSFCTEPEPTTTEGETAAADGTETTLATTPPGGSPDCITQTLGSTIKPLLDDVLGTSFDQYVQADELNEVVGAFISTLINNVLQEGITSVANDEGTRNAPVGTGGSIIATMLNSARSTRDKVAQYQANWQKIGEKANAAVAECSDSSLAKSTADKAAAAALKAQDALTALDALIQKMISLQTGPVQSSQLREVTQEYDALVSSGRLPTPAEITEAQRGAVDSPNSSSNPAAGAASPGSLYDQMEEMASGTCPASSS